MKVCNRNETWLDHTTQWEYGRCCNWHETPLRDIRVYAIYLLI